MKVRDLIKELLEKDMNGEVYIKANSTAFYGEVDLEGLETWSLGQGSKVVLIPKAELTDMSELEA